MSIPGEGEATAPAPLGVPAPHLDVDALVVRNGHASLPLSVADVETPGEIPDPPQSMPLAAPATVPLSRAPFGWRLPIGRDLAAALARVRDEGIRRGTSLGAWLARNTFAPDWLPRRWRHSTVAYLLACVLQLLVAMIAIPFLTTFPTFRVTGLLQLLAVLLAAFFWGAGPSLAGTLVGAALFDILVLTPPLALGPHPLAKLVELALFLAVGGAVSMLAGQQERARQEAVAARTELEAVFATVPDRLSVYDAHGTIVRLNPAAQAEAGPERGHEALSEFGPAYALRTLEGAPFPADALPVARALRGESVAGVEMRFRDAQAREEIISATAAPLRGPDGTVRGAVALTHDVTRLRQAEQDAAARARQMEAIFDAMTDGVLVYDADGRILYMNASLRRTYGLDARPDYAALSADERVPLLAPRGPYGEALPRDGWPHVRVLRGETLTEDHAVEARLRALDGREITVSYTGSPLCSEQGRIIGAVLVARDVSERREQERRLRWQASMLERTHDAIFMWELGGPIVYWNRGAERLYGYSAAEARGQISHDLLHTAFPAASAQAFEEVITQAGEWTGELTHTTRDGHEVTVLSRQQIVREADGRAYVLETAHDITARKRLEREAAERADELEAIQAVTDIALAHLALDAMLRELLERVRAGLAVDNVAILLPDATGRELRIYAARGPEEGIAGQVRVPIGAGVAGRIAATRKPLVIEDLPHADVVNPFLREHLRSLLGVPLLVEDRLVGVIHVSTIQPHQFSEREVRLLQLVADRMALAIARAQLHQEAVRARREAVEQAAQLYATIEAIADGVVVFDHAGRLLQMNEAAQHLLGYTSQPVYDAPPSGGSRRAVRDAEGHALPVDEWPVSRVLRGEIITGAEATDLLVRGADERELQLSVSGAPVRDAAGVIAGAVCVFRDVTEQRRLEQRTHDALKALLAMAGALVELPGEPGPDAAPLEGAEFELGTAPLPVAQRLAELTRDVLGCKRVSIFAIAPETRLQLPIAQVGLPPEQEPQWWVEQREHPTRYGEGGDPAARARFEAGIPFVVDMSEPPYNTLPNPYNVSTVMAAPMQVGGRMVGLLGVDYDGAPHVFTEQERALAAAVGQLGALVIERDRLLREREEARTNEKAAREVTRRYDQFLSIASHELKTPVTVIKANQQLALRQVTKAQAPVADDAEREAAWQEVHRLLERQELGMSRLNRLIDDLLDVSRIREGKLELRREPCDLLALVRERVDEQRQLNPERTITLETAPADLAELPVIADADRIGQVVTNYLTNALKYSHADQRVGVRVTSAGSGAWVEVRDRGVGLPPAELARIWEPFHRASGVEVVSGSGIGLGLGLHISKSLIERHGGQVDVRSRPGKGATFSFTIPLEQGAEG